MMQEYIDTAFFLIIESNFSNKIALWRVFKSLLPLYQILFKQRGDLQHILNAIFHQNDLIAR